MCVSGVRNVRFFVKFVVFCFLGTPVLRFALLPYYRRYLEVPIFAIQVQIKETLKVFDDFKNNQKVYEVIFLTYKSIYILKVYSILYTLR